MNHFLADGEVHHPEDIFALKRCPICGPCLMDLLRLIHAEMHQEARAWRDCPNPECQGGQVFVESHGPLVRYQECERCGGLGRVNPMIEARMAAAGAGAQL